MPVSVDITVLNLVTAAVGELSGVVTDVRWRVDGTHTNGKSTRLEGTTPIGPPDPESFTPFQDLTQSKVLGWISDKVNAEKIAAHMATILDPGGLPWDKPAEPATPTNTPPV